jgi:endonuclease/exonuclease/phosphatase family metal-dependent hydrolase
MAEILAHFDVIALQEVVDRGRGLRLILDRLGSNWGLLLTDPSPGMLGNRERMAFLYDRRKVLPSGVVCELVIPQERLARAAQSSPLVPSMRPRRAAQPASTAPRRRPRRTAPEETAAKAALDRQFARTPYAAGFRTLHKSFTLLNLHIIWGESPVQREQELHEIAHWIADWAKNSITWDSNLIAVGDFNIETVDSPLFQAFTSTGLQVPDDLLQAPRILYQRPDAPIKLYDQIAWFAGAGEVPPLELSYLSGGSFNFRPHVLRDRQVDLRRLSFMISDHFPLWAEFSVRN